MVAPSVPPAGITSIGIVFLVAEACAASSSQNPDPVALDVAIEADSAAAAQR
jgi:hypothetical protein